jgi:hypothetical protein
MGEILLSASEGPFDDEPGQSFATEETAPTPEHPLRHSIVDEPSMSPSVCRRPGEKGVDVFVINGPPREKVSYYAPPEQALTREPQDRDMRCVSAVYSEGHKEGSEISESKRFFGRLQGLAALIVLFVESWQLISHTQFTLQCPSRT